MLVEDKIITFVFNANSTSTKLSYIDCLLFYKVFHATLMVHIKRNVYIPILIYIDVGIVL